MQEEYQEPNVVKNQMIRGKRKKPRELGKLAIYAGLGATLVGGFMLNENRKVRNLENQINTAQPMTVEFTNPGQGYWDHYMAEDFDHNQDAWFLYQKRVKELNKDNTNKRGYITSKNITLPDVDGNGYVLEKERIK